MGFESFRVELRGGRASYQEADEFIRQLPHAKTDHESLPMPGSRGLRRMACSTSRIASSGDPVKILQWASWLIAFTRLRSTAITVSYSGMASSHRP